MCHNTSCSPFLVFVTKMIYHLMVKIKTTFDSWIYTIYTR
nr:MAG TPA: hypothetical protein [Caudoviricetes sp.]DAW85449.1 MAG TPA: hypothetical protein [Bacteriophage sp.]